MINVNLVFLNCVLKVVYELKIADVICAGTKGATIKGGTGKKVVKTNGANKLLTTTFSDNLVPRV